MPFIAHFGEVAGWVPYIGVGGFDVLTTMYRSRSGTKSELAGGVLTWLTRHNCHNFLFQVFGEGIDILGTNFSCWKLIVYEMLRPKNILHADVLFAGRCFRELAGLSHLCPFSSTVLGPDL